MHRSLIGIILVLSLGDVLVQGLSESEENAKIQKDNNCTCVRHHWCNDNNQIDPYTMSLQTRLGPRILCKSSGFRDELICCKMINISNTLNTDSRNPVDNIPKDPTTSPPLCGAFKTIVQKRIYNTEPDGNIGDGEFPGLVAIFKKTSSGTYEFCCGGTLIHPKVVLTAYHCIYKKKPGDLLVRANGKMELPTAERDTRYISEIVKHPRYDRYPRLYNDAALLFLDTPFTMDDYLNTLCLPPPDSNVDLDGCVVAGWGDGPDGRRTTNARKVAVPFMDHTTCQNHLRNSKLGQKFTLHYSFMCAGGQEGKDACIRDGGGPLMCEIPSAAERYFQAGIVSWGIGCGKIDVPGVYTDVGKISEWIEDELRDRSIKISN